MRSKARDNSLSDEDDNEGQDESDRRLKEKL